MSCSCPKPHTERDLRSATAFREVVGDNEDTLKAVWRMLYVLGHVDSLTPPSKYDTAQGF